MALLQGVADKLTVVAVAASVAWVVVRMQDRLVAMALEKTSVDRDPWVRALVPLSGLLTWALVGVVAFYGLGQFGIDLSPLLTVGGVSSVVLGFAAQGPLTNLLSGLQLYVSQPFVVGDKVEVRTAGGGALLAGWVERIEPLRTTITSDAFVPVSIPNKVLTDTLVSVTSRPAKSAFMARRMARPVVVKFQVRLEHLEKMPRVVEEMRAWVQGSGDTDPGLPRFASWEGIDGGYCSARVLCHTRADAGPQAVSLLRTAVLLRLAEVLAEVGAELYVPPA